MNDIKVYTKNEEKFMLIRHNFRENLEDFRLSRREARSWPKHKEWRVDSEIGEDLSLERSCQITEDNY